MSVISAFVVTACAATARAIGRGLPRAKPPVIGDVAAFVREGDLYTKILLYGPERRLTRTGYLENPVWSPTGRWIACHQIKSADTDGGLTVVSSDGRIIRNLTHMDDFTWSPNTDEIACVDNEGSLSRVNLWTGVTKEIVPFSESLQITWFAWSPDGKRIAYTTTKYDQPNTGRGFSMTLWVSKIDGSSAHRICQSNGHQSAPELAGWSHDGRFVLFSKLVDYPASSVNMDGLPLYACRVDKGGPFPIPGLKYARTHDAQVLGDHRFVSFRRRDSRLAVSVGSGRSHADNKRIMAVDLRTRQVTPLTRVGQAATYPVWSPDGTRIAYIGAPNVAPDDNMTRSFQQMRIWVMAANGSNARSLGFVQANDATSPVWLSDGKHVLFEQSGEKIPNSLWLVDASTGISRRVVTFVGHKDPDLTDSWPNICFDLWTPARY